MSQPFLFGSILKHILTILINQQLTSNSVFIWLNNLIEIKKGSIPPNSVLIRSLHPVQVQKIISMRLKRGDDCSSLRVALHTETKKDRSNIGSILLSHLINIDCPHSLLNITSTLSCSSNPYIVLGASVLWYFLNASL